MAEEEGATPSTTVIPGEGPSSAEVPPKLAPESHNTLSHSKGIFKRQGSTPERKDLETIEVLGRAPLLRAPPIPTRPTLQCNLVVTEASDRNPGSGISVDIVAITGSCDHAGSAWTFRIDPSKHDAVKDKSKREHVSKGPKPKESAPVIPASTSVSKKTQAVTVVSEEPLVVAGQKGGADKGTTKSQPLRAQAYQGQQVPWLEGPRLLQERLYGARILRFEYHGGLLCQQPLSLEVVTRDLCYRLREQRREHPLRPIVFFGHDHGILVVAKTILALSSNHEDTAHGLFRHIAGLVILDPSPKSELQVDGMLDNFVMEENKLFLRRGGALFAELREQNYSTSLIKDFERVMYQASIHQPGILPARLHYNNQISDENSPILEKFLVRMRESIKTILDLHFLLSAAAVGDDDALERVLAGDASADVQNYAKRTALHLAVENGHKQTVRLLLGKYGADVALQDKEGSSAIHLAVRSGPDAEELIFLLLEKGADVYAENNEGNSALAIAKKNNLQKIVSYLEHRPLVEGLSENPVELRARNPPGTDAKEVCKRFRATIAEFFFIDNKEKYVLDQPSVYDLVYGDGPDKILNAARHTSVTQKPVCRWYHIPANNPAWMDDLFAKIGIIEDSLTEYQHDGRTPWSRFMIPQARRIKPRLYNDDRTRRWQVEELNRNSVVLFTPYLNYERRCDQHLIYHRIKMVQVFKDYYDGMVSIEKVIEQLSQCRRQWVEIEKRDNEGVSELDQGTGTVLMGQISPAHLSDGDVPDALTDRQSLESPPTKSYGSDSQDPLEHWQQLALEKDLIGAYLDHEMPFHVRRTLDQSHYFMLEETAKRDRDQVVLRAARQKAQRKRPSESETLGSHTQTSPASETHNMIMVDQLWLWVFGDTVITSFPQKWMQSNSNNEEDILARFVRGLCRHKNKRSPITSSKDLAVLIAAHCSNVIDRSRASAKLQLHHDFECAIGAVADAETALFDEFDSNSKKALDKQGTKHDKQVELELLDIGREIKLLTEIKDIRDEIRIILKILDEQATSLRDLMAVFYPVKRSSKVQIPTPNDNARTLTRSIDNNIRDFKRMLAHADEVHKALNHLLDLKQKQANALVASSAREGAEETARQGNTILVFTIVTIVFGSLSFMSTFLALNVTAFPQDDKGSPSWGLAHVTGYVVGISSALSIPFIIIAFWITPVIDKAKNYRARWTSSTPSTISEAPITRRKPHRRKWLRRKTWMKMWKRHVQKCFHRKAWVSVWRKCVRKWFRREGWAALANFLSTRIKTCKNRMAIWHAAHQLGPGDPDGDSDSDDQSDNDSDNNGNSGVGVERNVDAEQPDPNTADGGVRASSKMGDQSNAEKASSRSS